MKVIIDTNILISGAFKNRNLENIILFIAFNEAWNWIVSREILQEYEGVLNRKRLNIEPERKGRFLYLIQELITFFEVDAEIDFPRDRKDGKLIACAVAAKADFLITGDKDFKEAQQLIETQITTVKEFQRLFCRESENS